MTALKNDRLIRALCRQPTDVTPIWIMRQAGRYLPEYRKTRGQVNSFIQLYKSPELATEITLQPIRRYPLDAAIIFSDILIVPEAMGMKLQFIDGRGPVFDTVISQQSDIDALQAPSPQQEMPWLAQAVQHVCRELNGQIPLIGFAGSPWTLSTYMVEGKAKNDFRKIKSMLYKRPDLLNNLLTRLVSVVTDCLNMQIEAGVQCIMLFDSWGGILPPRQYLEFSLAPMKKVIAGLRREYNGQQVPCILFTKGGNHCLNEIADSGCDALGLDWTADIDAARQTVGERVALQGNLDPDVLSAPDAVIRRETQRILDCFDSHAGHVFNLGHGIKPGTSPDKVAVLIDAVHGRKKTAQKPASISKPA